MQVNETGKLQERAYGINIDNPGIADVWLNEDECFIIQKHYNAIRNITFYSGGMSLGGKEYLSGAYLDEYAVAIFKVKYR